MTDRQKKIDQLDQKLELLLKRQDEFAIEINSIQKEIIALKAEGIEADKAEKPKPAFSKGNSFDDYIQRERKSRALQSDSSGQSSSEEKPLSPKKPLFDVNWEKFIGENLINKIGILITILGVAVGAKYAIDNQMISPLTRIILGYLLGGALLVTAFYLKKKYHNFSAVLLSGAMAIMYFITFAAYDFYQIIPQGLTFGLMTLFTIFTALSAIQYDQQVIAHIGLLGAYAVPFLLSDGSGNVTFLFSYMAVINIGILSIAVKKYWRSLYYASFGLSFIIFFSWYSTGYKMEEHFALALIFLAIFFVIFYATFLINKLLKRAQYEQGDIVLIMLNAFIFYGMGYAIMEEHPTADRLLGFFTLINAFIHLIPSMIIYRLKLADRKLFYLVTGLVLIFVTMAIPVQLDGNWVTLLWVGEAALLFWIGRTKKISFYEKIAYPLMAISLISILQDWGNSYHIYDPAIGESHLIPLLNINFLSSALFIGCFVFIQKTNLDHKSQITHDFDAKVKEAFYYAIPLILIGSVYMAFRLEISNYFHQLFMDSQISINTGEEGYQNNYRNYDLKNFSTIWIINYSLLFVSLLTVFNGIKLKNDHLSKLNVILITLSVLVFLFQGLLVLSELRENYLDQYLSEYYDIGIFNIAIRYISMLFLALPIAVFYKYMLPQVKEQNLLIPAELMFYTIILWVASSELLNWLDIFGSANSYKLGLSILWGVFALMLSAYGIWKRKKHIRIAAFSLFGLTLMKLFLYDISHLETIAKTIVFVSLGILLLIISFLYNKYKHLINEDENN